MKQYYIYKIICLCDEWNGKFYIGKHYGELNDNYTGSGRLIREYFKEFGKEKDITYEKIILEIGDEFNICDLEREYIREGIESALCLNINRVSSRGNFGQKLSKEHRRKLSESGKRRKHSEEVKQKISKSLKGKHLSEERKQKISESLKGKQLSDERRKHMSEAQKKRRARN